KGNYSGGAQPKSYVFSPRPNPVQEAVLEQWGINMINSEIDDSGKALEEFLKQFI
ncbi:Sir2 family NAD-dependent protein deacetylase, partial [Vibrio parahaemolyticus]